MSDWFIQPDERPQAGKLLVICHHAGGFALSYLPLLRFFPDDWQPVLLELPGRGLSRDKAYVEDLGELTAILKDELVSIANGRDIHLFGHSMGGLIAYRLATALSDQVRCLTISGIGPEAYRRFQDPLQTEAFFQLMEGPEVLPASIRNRPESLAIYRRILRLDTKLVEAFRVTAPLNIPLQLCAGADDEVVPLHLMEAWRAHAPVLRFEVFPGRHFYWQNCLQQLAAFIVAGAQNE